MSAESTAGPGAATAAGPATAPPPARLARLRLGGLLGTVLLAGGGHLAGARPGPAPASQAEALWGDGAPFRLGLAACLVGLVLLASAWWRIGAEMRAGWTPHLRWTLVTGAWWAVPLLFTAPLGSRDLYAYACHGAVWVAGHDPYTVGAADGGCPWLPSVPPLWHDATAPYGAVALLASAVAVAAARLAASGDAAQLLVAMGVLRLVALAGVLLVAAGLPRLARACRVDPAAATWLGLVTPVVGLHAVAGAHHDALVAGLVVAGLALAVPPASSGSHEAGARRTGRRPDLTTRRDVGVGVALGLAATVKVTAAVAVPFALLMVAGGTRRWVRAGTVAASAVAAYAGLALVTGLGLGWLAALPDTGALVQWSAPPTGLGMAVGYVLRGLGWPGAFDTAVAAARVAGLVALAAISTAMLVRAWRRAGDPSQVVLACGVVLAAVVLLGPVVYPWYALLPLAVLAAAVAQPRARWWLAVATLVLAGLALPSGLGVPVLTKLPGALLVAVAAAVLTVRWWRRRRPAGRRRRSAPGPAPPAPGG